MNRASAFALGAGLLASGAAVTPAAAAPLCAGTQATVVLCVDPTGSVLYDDCIYLMGPPCHTATVPGPTIQCGGNIGQYLCAFNYDDPGPPVPIN